MTKDEAQKIIDDCKGWNIEQKSCSYAFQGVRTKADDAYDAKRDALRAAWRVIGELDARTQQEAKP